VVQLDEYEPLKLMNWIRFPVGSVLAACPASCSALMVTAPTDLPAMQHPLRK